MQIRTEEEMELRSQWTSEGRTLPPVNDEQKYVCMCECSMCVCVNVVCVYGCMCDEVSVVHTLCSPSPGTEASLKIT